MGISVYVDGSRFAINSNIFIDLLQLITILSQTEQLPT